MHCQCKRQLAMSGSVVAIGRAERRRLCAHPPKGAVVVVRLVVATGREGRVSDQQKAGQRKAGHQTDHPHTVLDPGLFTTALFQRTAPTPGGETAASAGTKNTEPV